MMTGSDQQVADFVGDHASQYTAGVRAGAIRGAGHTIGKHGRDPTPVGLSVHLRFA